MNKAITIRTLAMLGCVAMTGCASVQQSPGQTSPTARRTPSTTSAALRQPIQASHTGATASDRTARSPFGQSTDDARRKERNPDVATGTSKPQIRLGKVVEGSRRFPTQALVFHLRDQKVPLQTQAVVPLQGELQSVESANGYTHLACTYGPFPRDQYPLVIYFWNTERPELPDEVVEPLRQRSLFSGTPLSDVAITTCPKTMGLAMRVVNGSLPANSIEAANNQFDIKQAERLLRFKESGQRFSSQLFDATLDQDSKKELFDGGVVPISQIKGVEASTRTYIIDMSDKDIRNMPPVSAAVAAEIDSLNAQGYTMRNCAYGKYDKSRSQIIIESGSNFWNTKRPPKISEALARRIEETGYPLADVAVSHCPEYFVQAIALAQGDGKQAQTIKEKANEIAYGNMSYCERKKSGESSKTEVGKGGLIEPTEGQMCLAVEKFTQNAAIEHFKILLGLSPTVHVNQFKKKSCTLHKNDKLRLKCTYEANITMTTPSTTEFADKKIKLPVQATAMTLQSGEGSMVFSDTEKGWKIAELDAQELQAQREARAAADRSMSTSNGKSFNEVMRERCDTYSMYGAGGRSDSGCQYK